MSQPSPDLRPREPHVLDSRGRMILVLLLGVQFLIALDFSILNVALPTIGADVGFSLDSLQWVATSFALAATGFTLFFGRVADIAGRRRVFMAGMALLGLASAVGAAAQTPTVLLVARVLQGLATAMIVPSGLALLTTSFPEGPLRAKALGLNGALLSAGFTVGALVGGLLTGLLSWRWAFLINIPVCVLVLMTTPALIADSRLGRRSRLDVPGTLTVTGGLLALVYGVTSAGHYGWSDSHVVWPLAAAVVLLGAFWVIELRSPEPQVAVAVLTRPTVLWGNVGGLITFTMFTAFTVLLSAGRRPDTELTGLLLPARVCLEPVADVHDVTEVIGSRDAPLTRSFGSQPMVAVLRPDGHLAYRCSPKRPRKPPDSCARWASASDLSSRPMFTRPHRKTKPTVEQTPQERESDDGRPGADHPRHAVDVLRALRRR